MASVSAIRIVAQFVAVPLLARYLSPTDYGIVGMAMPFLAFAQMIADAGLGMSLVRSSDLNREVPSTCFWLSVILSLALAIALAGSAPIASMVLSEPALQLIIVTLGLMVVAQGIAAVPMSLLQRDQKFHTVAAIEITAVVAGIATAVFVALNGGGAWALVDQQLVYFFLRVVATLFASRFRPLFVLNLKDAMEHLTFGRDILGINMVSFITRSIDNLIIGGVLGAAAVGLYSMASQFARLPLMLVTGPLQYVVYSQVSRLGGNRLAVRDTFLMLTRSLAILTFPAIGMVAIAHHPLFTLLLSRKWTQAGELFLLMAPGCAAHQLTAIAGTIMLVLGRTDIQLRTAAESGVIWLVLLISTVWFGSGWVAVANSWLTVLYSCRFFSLALPVVECSVGLYLRTIAGPILTTAICIGVFVFLSRLFSPGVWIQLYLSSGLALLGTLAGALPQRRAIFKGLALAA